MPRIAKPASTAINELPNPGPGLFVDARSHESAKRAYVAMCILLSSEGRPVINGHKLFSDLRFAARNYWTDHDYDERMTLADVRNNINQLNQGLAQVMKALDGLESRSRQHLTAEVMNRKTGDSPSFLTSFRTQCARLAAACEPISNIEGVRGSRYCYRHCCARLIELRESLENHSFAWSLQPRLEGTSNATKEFARPDAQFVLKLMQAIDGDVTFERVRSALTELRKARNEKNRRRELKD